MENNYKTRNVVLVVSGISVILILIVAFAFMMFFKEQEKNVNEVVKNSVVTMNYKTATNEFALTNLTSMSNEAGKDLRTEGSYFDFSVSSEMDQDASVQYEIALIKDESSTIPDSDIVVYLEKQNSGSYAKVEDPSAFTPTKKKTSLGSPAKSMVLDKVTLSSEKKDNYRLRLWVKEGATVAPGATYSVKVKVYGKAK